MITQSERYCYVESLICIHILSMYVNMYCSTHRYACVHACALCVVYDERTSPCISPTGYMATVCDTWMWCMRVFDMNVRPHVNTTKLLCVRTCPIFQPLPQPFLSPTPWNMQYIRKYLYPHSLEIWSISLNTYPTTPCDLQCIREYLFPHTLEYAVYP